MSRTPEWHYGMVLQRGKQKIMFVMFDKERTRMMGYGMEWFVGMRMDHNDRVPPQFYKVGDMGNYPVAGWKLADE